jgi:acetyl esterase
MALDPSIAALLRQPGMQLGAPPPEVTPAMMREFAKTLRTTSAAPQVHAIRDITIEDHAAGIPVRLYYPHGHKLIPLIVFFHGGGWTLCDLDSHDFMCRDLAKASGCAVAAVQYRLAPEVPFPGALDDCYAAVEYFAAKGAAYGFDGKRIAVCGDSAGGNLAAAVAIRSHAGGGPRLLHQALMCPALDARCDSESMETNGAGFMLSRDLMQWFWGCYLADASDALNPLACPAGATNLAGLPPASILTAEFDPLRDEAELYADRLRAAGVTVIARRYPGMIHDFMTMPDITPMARYSIADVAGDIAASLNVRSF